LIACSHDARRREAAARDLAVAGGRDAPIVVVAYDDRWPASFAVEAERLAPLLPGVEIHHIDSTAVAGLAAKPVIDLMSLVADLDGPIGSLVDVGGYEYPAAYNETLRDRRWLCRPSAAHRTHHLHLVSDADVLARQLRFRDRLRADAELRDEYAQLKLSLAARHPNDREAYTDAKTAFVSRVLADLLRSRPPGQSPPSQPIGSAVAGTAAPSSASTDASASRRIAP
jgi:GrpB-like predicted nucleotidyltransferase (UPF0157 family)